MAYAINKKGRTETYPQPSFTLGELEILVAILSNIEQAVAVAAGPAAFVAVTAPAITPATGTSVGNVINRVAASATVSGSAGVEVTFRLYRDATAIGPVITVTSDAVNGLSSGSINFIDVPPDLSAHTYSLRATPATGNVSVAANAGVVNVGQQVYI